MKLAERMAVSYDNVSDKYSEEFIKSLHRAWSSTRALVRHPNPDGEPYGITNHRFQMRMCGHSLEYITYWIREAGDDRTKLIHEYFLEFHNN